MRRLSLAMTAAAALCAAALKSGTDRRQRRRDPDLWRTGCG